MAEICTPPLEGVDENGDPTYTFTERHSLADIARWIMRNPVDGQELFDLLYIELEQIEDKKALDKARRLC